MPSRNLQQHNILWVIILCMGITFHTPPEDLGPEYELAWPPELFQSEVSALITSNLSRYELEKQGAFLLEQAFVDPAVSREFRQSSQDFTDWQSPMRLTQTQLLNFFSDSANKLPKAHTSAPYWIQKKAGAAQGQSSPFGRDNLWSDWLKTVENLIDEGYYSKIAPDPCVDDDIDVPEVHDQLDWHVQRLIGVPEVWSSSRTSEPGREMALTLIEIFHDLISRPRSRFYHDFSNCGWHYSDYSRTTGQALYRWKINKLLLAHQEVLVLSDSGSDRGRLVHKVDEGRTVLVHSVSETEDSTSKNSVDHAIALFRKRDSTFEDKRSACAELALILEDRRDLIQENFLKKDEKLIFQLANQFHIRHRDGRQHGDYAVEFLEWIFWIYLSTVELTNQIIDSQGPVEMSNVTQSSEDAE